MLLPATPKSPPLPPSPLSVPPLLLSLLYEDSMLEPAAMWLTLLVLSMLPRGRLRLMLNPMFWDMEVTMALAMLDMEATMVWDMLVWDMLVWDTTVWAMLLPLL